MGEWDEQAPTATGEFEQWAIAQFCEVAVQVHVFIELLVFDIIIRGNQVVFIHLSLFISD
jgi:hypothetical protein